MKIRRIIFAITAVLLGSAVSGCSAGLSPGSSGSGSGSSGHGTTLSLSPSGSFPSDGDTSVALDMEGGFAAIIFPDGLTIDEGSVSMTLEAAGVNYSLGERLPDADIAQGPSPSVAGTVECDSAYVIDGTPYNACAFVVSGQLERGMNYELTLAAGTRATDNSGQDYELANAWTLAFATTVNFRYSTSDQYSWITTVVPGPDGLIFFGGDKTDGVHNRVFIGILNRDGKVLASEDYYGMQMSNYPMLETQNVSLRKLLVKGESIYACGFGEYAGFPDHIWCDRFTYAISGESAAITWQYRTENVLSWRNGVQLWDLAMDSAGDLYLVGFIRANDPLRYYPFVAKTHDDGNLLVTAPTIGANPYEHDSDDNTYKSFFAIDIDDADNVFVAGVITTSVTTGNTVIARFDANLQLQEWHEQPISIYHGWFRKVFYALKALSQDDILYVAGFTSPGEEPQEETSDPLIQAYRLSWIGGGPLDEVIPHAPRGGQPAYYLDLATTAGGDAVVTGAFTNTNGYKEVAVERYRLTGGNTLESRYVATQEIDRYDVSGFAVAIDTDDNIVVGGEVKLWVPPDALDPADQFRAIWKLDHHLNITDSAPPE